MEADRPLAVLVFVVACSMLLTCGPPLTLETATYEELTTNVYVELLYIFVYHLTTNSV